MRSRSRTKALADETRLAILKAIAATDSLTRGDLPSLRGVTPATISHRLKILRQAELIESHKKGQFVHSSTIAETMAGYMVSLALFSKSIRVGRHARKK
jgi:DNA-binding transcriptional ArsR family regulator